MKIEVSLLLFLLCLILSGCSNNNSSDNKDTQTSNDITPAEISATPTQNEDPTITITEKASETATIIPDTGIPPYLDYSDHLDGRAYQTVLADPSKLKEGNPVFALKENVANWSWIKFSGFVKDDIWGYDVRSCDISKADFSKVDDFNYLSFNSETIWPEELPDGFDPEAILEYNKNPGLGIRELHDRGITGSSVGIAIIDQALLIDHEQYKDNLMYYERIHCTGDEAQMHGPAVASIAVGKTIGVAPDAKLYYIAETHGHFINSSLDYDYTILADSILRVIEINKNLPDDEKIRVISISLGYDNSVKGYEELTSAIDEANEENIFVITTSTDMYYDFDLFGMNRDYLKDPDDFNSYIPAGWIAKEFYTRPVLYQNFILVPMGSRTYASCTGTKNYEIGRNGGLSWAVPWCAGFYALCCQVKPDITPEEFIEAVKSTAVTIDLEHDGETYKFGKIINPAGVIDKLKP
jgi:hypothetical protein